MRMRLDLIDDLLQQHLSLTDTAPVKSDMMQEFEVVLTQMPYVGGAESRMSDFFMRLLGFSAGRHEATGAEEGQRRKTHAAEASETLDTAASYSAEAVAG